MFTSVTAWGKKKNKGEKMCVKMGPSWSAQAFRQEDDTPPGLGAKKAHTHLHRL